jgi:MFS family permease
VPDNLIVWCHMSSARDRQPSLFYAASYVVTAPALLSIVLTELIMLYALRLVGPQAIALRLVGGGIGVFVVGVLADRYCRRKLLIAVHMAGLAGLALCVFTGWNAWMVFILSVLYAPSPVARASLLDSLPGHPQIQVLAVAIGARFVPYCFYPSWNSWSESAALAILVGLVLFNLLLLYFTYEDVRRVKPKRLFTPPRKEKRERYLCILFALFLAEGTLYVTEMLSRMGEAPTSLYTALGMAFVLGTLVHLLLRPAVSSMQLLRFCYALGFMVTVIANLSILYSEPTVQEMRNLALLLGCLSGFYLPTAYDLLLRLGSPYRKGLWCGNVEAVQCAAALFAIIPMGMLNLAPRAIVHVAPGMLLGALVVQYSAELRTLTLFLSSLGRVSHRATQIEK